MNLDIYQLSKLVSIQKVKALGLFKDSKVDSETKYLFLFENIHKSKIKNDDEAKKALNYSKNSKAFSKFKERYTRKLLDYISLSDAHNLSSEYVFEEHYRLLKLLAVAKLIQLKHQVYNSIKLYKHIFEQATKLEYVELQLFAGLVLRKHYSYIEPNKKLYKYYDNALDKIHNSISKNYLLTKYYDLLSHENVTKKYINQKKYQTDTFEKCNSFLENLEDEDSHLYKSQVYDLMAYAYLLNNNTEDSINISKLSVELLKENEHTPKFKLYIAYKTIMSSYLKIQDYENAMVYLNKTLAMHTQENYNYFRLKSIEYTIYANTKDYVSLFKITSEVINSKKLMTYENAVQEWKIREAYANVLLESGFIKEEEIKTLKHSKFKLNKFLNEIDNFTKDKRGTNISILVVELIHFLIRKQYDKLTDRLDALNQYTYRYLRNDHTLRSNCFIKMLLKLPEAEYHPLRTVRYIKKYEKKLRENPFEVSLKLVDAEIIPYENLWEIILEILDVNLSKKKS